MKVSVLFSPIVSLVELVFVQVWPFLTFYAIVNMMFAFIFRVLGLDYDQEEYDSLPEFVAYFLLAFRNSVGDMSAPSSSFWDDQCD